MIKKSPYYQPVTHKTEEINPSDGSVFFASSFSRPGLLSVAYPQLKVKQHTRSFFFYEPTVLIVLTGSIEFTISGATHRLANGDSVAFIDQGVIADYTKSPPDIGTPFRSLFLTFSEGVSEHFYQLFEQHHSPVKSRPQINRIALTEALNESVMRLLNEAVRTDISDDRIRLRIYDLLLLMAEHGVHFALSQRKGIFPRLSHLLRDAPEMTWTARVAGEKLAMSESTLRRRLREEGLSFEKLLLDIRMQHGLMLVQTTQWNMAQVADACGYQSASRFAERFTQRFGLSPSKFR